MIWDQTVPTFVLAVIVVAIWGELILGLWYPRRYRRRILFQGLVVAVCLAWAANGSWVMLLLAFPIAFVLGRLSTYLESEKPTS